MVDVSLEKAPLSAVVAFGATISTTGATSAPTMEIFAPIWKKLPIGMKRVVFATA